MANSRRCSTAATTPKPKKIVTRLIEETDFEPVDAGPLENARYLEAYAILVIRLGHTLGLGTNIAMKLMRR